MIITNNTITQEQDITTLALHTRRVLHFLLLASASLLFLWATRVPGIEEGWPILISMMLWLFIVSTWIISLAKGQRTSTHNRYIVTVSPAIFIATVLAGLLGIPERIAFNTSENELVALAEQSLHNPKQTSGGWAGAFHVKSRESIGNGTILYLSGASSISFQYGLGYFPDKPPLKRSEWLECEHYQGPWYIMKYYAL